MFSKFIDYMYVLYLLPSGVSSIFLTIQMTFSIGNTDISLTKT